MRLLARESEAVGPRASGAASPRPLAACAHRPLRLPVKDARILLDVLGPSLALWRAAEIAVLREQVLDPPVLDLGCGEGIVTSFITSHAAFGLDPDPLTLARASRLGVYAHLLSTTLENSDLPEAGIATVLSNSVLEHLPRLDVTLATIARVLRPGGLLLATVPTDAFSAWLTLPSTRYAAWRNRQLLHRNLLPAAHWRLHLARAGLELIAVRPYLRRSLVTAWDALELLQQVRTGGRQVFGMFWRRVPSSALDRMARLIAGLDLSAAEPGGGRLLVARKPVAEAPHGAN